MNKLGSKGQSNIQQLASSFNLRYLNLNFTNRSSNGCLARKEITRHIRLYSYSLTRVPSISWCQCLPSSICSTIRLHSSSRISVIRKQHSWPSSWPTPNISLQIRFIHCGLIIASWVMKRSRCSSMELLSSGRILGSRLYFRGLYIKMEILVFNQWMP